jgi:Na+-translocating ferredoxin:NAD+ oxidoreductase RNF subunit RnfB
MVVNPLLHRGSGKVHEILTPSRYRAVVDPELCSGCQTCVKRCMFDAIQMEPVSGSMKLRSTIVKEHCLGCGVVVKCPKRPSR